MAPPTESQELLAAWRALAGDAETDGWRTIPVTIGGACRVLAGRRFPDNAEALLVNFPSIRVPRADKLPQGRGFGVAKAEPGVEQGASGSWVALTRELAGTQDLFAVMANDVIATIQASTIADDTSFQLFLARIRAWQDFMGRDGGLVLAPESEVGLFGELEMLESILDAGVPARTAIEAWQGPLAGIHDFVFGTGAIEVKSTVSAGEFPATVGSIEQLDDSLITPLFLGAFRLAVGPGGRTLASRVFEIRGRLQSDSAARVEFDNRLVRVGFFDAWAQSYTRRFEKVDSRLLVVSAAFPRLIRANVGVAIRQVRYELDLDLVSVPSISIEEGLAELGVID